jgi:hypothetical protein
MPKSLRIGVGQDITIVGFTPDIPLPLLLFKYHKMTLLFSKDLKLTVCLPDMRS